MIDIRCRPEMSGKELARAAAVPAGPRTGGGAVPALECSATAAPLLLFIDFDQLSDKQIAKLCGGALGGDELRASAVLLAPLDFLARLERPALRFLKGRLAAHFCVQEVGDDEVSFLHNQLLTQRDRRSEARGFRRDILIGLAACMVGAAAVPAPSCRCIPTPSRSWKPRRALRQARGLVKPHRPSGRRKE